MDDKDVWKDWEKDYKDPWADRFREVDSDWGCSPWKRARRWRVCFLVSASFNILLIALLKALVLACR
ncbi:MAG: hypothetical protein ACLPX8_05225 [Bryobacteraceae bacterium]|jgi:hypothetical protein